MYFLFSASDNDLVGVEHSCLGESQAKSYRIRLVYRFDHPYDMVHGLNQMNKVAL